MFKNSDSVKNIFKYNKRNNGTIENINRNN